MTRTNVIVAIWLLVSGGIGDEVLAARGRPPLALLAVYACVTALTTLALWLELKDDAPDGRVATRRRRRARLRYD